MLLKGDAKKIYSIDVGKNQLHEKLRNEKKIISMEKTNARYIDQRLIKDKIDLIVCDVSFISGKYATLYPGCISCILNNK